MDGVEILNVLKIIETSYKINKEMIILFILAFIAICFAIGFACKKKLIFVIFYIITMAFMFLTLNVFYKTRDKIEKTRYEVTISDEVNYNEFIEKYNVIEKRGKIFVVEEK